MGATALKIRLTVLAGLLVSLAAHAAPSRPATGARPATPGARPAAAKATRATLAEPPHVDVSFPAADSVRIAGRWYAGPAKAPVLVLATGTSGGHPGRARAVSEFHHRGFSVLTFDYRDLDRTTGALPESLRFAVFASRWADDMVGALRYARAHADSGGHVFAWGRHAGALVATAAAARDPRLCDAIVIEGLFPTLRETLERLGTWMSPPIVELNRTLVRERDEPQFAAARIPAPLLAVLAAKDDDTPPSATERAISSRRHATDRLPLPNAGHDDTLDAPGYFDSVAAWLRRWLGAPPRG